MNGWATENYRQRVVVSNLMAKVITEISIEVVEGNHFAPVVSSVRSSVRSGTGFSRNTPYLVKYLICGSYLGHICENFL